MSIVPVGSDSLFIMKARLADTLSKLFLRCHLEILELVVESYFGLFLLLRAVDAKPSQELRCRMRHRLLQAQTKLELYFPVDI